MMSRSKIPSQCVKHVPKMFQGVDHLTFRKDEVTLESLVSWADEKVVLSGEVVVQGRVELWLQALEAEIRSTLHGLAFRTLHMVSFGAK